MKPRRCLRILVVAGRLPFVLEGAHDFSIDEPVDLLRLPVIGVGVETSLWIIGGFLSATIIIPGNTFAEIIGLDEASTLIEVVAGPFEVELVLVVTHEHAAGDQTGTGRRLNFNVDATKQEVILSPDVGRVVPLHKREIGTHGLAESDGGVISQDPVAR